MTAEEQSGGANMDQSKKTTERILAALLVGCLTMGLVDAVIQPGYFVKSMLKLGLFLILPYLAVYRSQPEAMKQLFRWQGVGVWPLVLGLGTFGGILGLYFLVGPYFDFSMVTGALQGELGINAGNFVFVALYISFINSLLEEFFFRGFGYLTLRNHIPEKWAMAVSSLSFALYHVAMIVGWFRLDLLLLLISLLVFAGVMLNLFDRRSGNLYLSWFVHMFANFAINTVGFLLFGLI